MEATHFIEIWRGSSSATHDYVCLDISYLETQLTATRFSPYLQTIAVWKIKPTNVPLGQRLAKRIGGNEGDMCSIEYFKKFLELNAHLKKEFINAIIGV
jgi:hypothetical protein